MAALRVEVFDVLVMRMVFVYFYCYVNLEGLSLQEKDQVVDEY